MAPDPRTQDTGQVTGEDARRGAAALSVEATQIADELVDAATDAKGQESDRGQGSQDTPAGASTTKGRALTGKHLVNWGGAEREVDVDQLVKRAMESEGAASLKAEAERTLLESAAYKELHEFVGGLRPDELQRLQQVVRGGKKVLAHEDPDESEDEPDFKALLKGQNGTAQARGVPETERLARIEQAITVLLDRERGRVEQDARKTREQLLEERMNTFSVFNPKQAHYLPEAADMARQAALLELAAMQQPTEKDLESIVGKHARTAVALQKRLQQSFTGTGPGRQEESVYVSREPATLLPRLNRSPSGDDLLNGRIRDQAMKIIAGL